MTVKSYCYLHVTLPGGETITSSLIPCRYVPTENNIPKAISNLLSKINFVLGTANLKIKQPALTTEMFEGRDVYSVFISALNPQKPKDIETLASRVRAFKPTKT